jgi:selenocysteine lyase/cysteine desulfurase
LSELFGADAENVVFTYNTTYALNIVIKSYIRYSSHILISDMEHNSVLRPVYELSKQKLCTYDVLNTEGTDEEIFDRVKKAIKSDTKMIVCTHASNICSRRLPIEKIGKLCEENNIFFVVDGAQSAGLYNIDVKKMHINALCVPGHKSLYGPQGVGAIIFNSDNVGRSFIQGGTGINSLELEMPDFLPEAYEAGTLSTPLIAGLCESLKWLKAVEIDKIRKYEEDLYSYLLKKLNSNENVIVYEGSKNLGNTLIFNVKNFSPNEISKGLDIRGICTRSGFHCTPLAHSSLNVGNDGAVRVSLSVYNTKNEINVLFEALTEIMNEKSR